MVKCFSSSFRKFLFNFFVRTWSSLWENIFHILSLLYLPFLCWLVRFRLCSRKLALHFECKLLTHAEGNGRVYSSITAALSFVNMTQRLSSCNTQCFVNAFGHFEHILVCNPANLFSQGTIPTFLSWLTESLILKDIRKNFVQPSSRMSSAYNKCVNFQLMQIIKVQMLKL